MREAMVICPMKDNEGVSLEAVRMYAEHEMSTAFGGVTTTASSGSWVSPQGELITEPVWQLVSAMDANEKNDATLKSIAKRILRHGKQQAVYMRAANGDVHILEADVGELMERLQGRAGTENKHMQSAIEHERQLALDDIDYEGFNDLGPSWSGNK